MKRLLLLAAFLLGGWLIPATASAAFVHDDAGNTIQPYAGWAATAKVPAPNVDVTLTLGVPADTFCNPPGNQWYGGEVADFCSVPGHIYITPRAMTAMRYKRQGFLYELGHIFDYSMMTDAARHTFERYLGESSTPWGPAPGQPETSLYIPSEQFAQAYWLCATYGSDYVDSLNEDHTNYWPNQRTYNRICKLIYRVGTGS